MKNLNLLLFIFLCAAGSAGASVTLKIGTSGWGNATTASTNNLIWGVVISSDASGFSTSALSAALVNFSIPSVSSPANPQQIGSSVYYFARAQSLTSSSGPPSFTNGFMNTVQFNLNAPVNAGDNLGLIWFDTAGATAANSKYGFQDLAYLVPSEGSNITSGITSTPGLANLTITAVPEPSRMILLGFGLVGVFFRRRR